MPVSFASMVRPAALAAAAVGLACTPGRMALGVETQAYPAGVIPGLHAQWELSARSSVTARFAHNFSDRRDFGERDDEEGGGFGGGLGYRRYFDSTREGWLAGVRIDVWDLAIDWEDAGGTPAAISGTTDLIVLQPTAEIGWGLALSGGWRLELTAGLGAEINVESDGEDVGEGAILLLGGTLVRSL